MPEANSITTSPPAPTDPTTDLNAQIAALRQTVESERSARIAAEQRASEISQQAERSGWINRAAADHGLSPELARRLVGSTQAEIASDAANLAALIKAQPQPQRSNAHVGLVGDPQPASRASLLFNRLRGSSGNVRITETIDPDND